MKDINVFEYLDERPDAEDILCLISERLGDEFISCGADIDQIYPDDGTFIVSMSAPFRIVDEGIGPYEFWGCCGVHHDYEPELCDEGDIQIDTKDNRLAAAGMSATATSDGDVCYGDDDCGRGTATCDEQVTVFVTDPAKFEEWVAKRLSSAKAA